MRYLGLLIMASACTGAGFLAAESWRERLEILKLLRQMAYHLKGRILYANETLPEALFEVGDVSGAGKAIFTSEEADGEGAGSAFFYSLERRSKKAPGGFSYESRGSAGASFFGGKSGVRGPRDAGTDAFILFGADRGLDPSAEKGAGGADKAVSLSGNGGRFVFIGSAGIRRQNGSKSDF